MNKCEKCIKINYAKKTCRIALILNVKKGGDDRRVLLWKLEEAMAGIGQPIAMKNEHYSNIFCLSFNNDSTKIFSGGNDEAVIVHDAHT